VGVAAKEAIAAMIDRHSDAAVELETRKVG
jgi:hypothetical protein